MDLSIIQQIAPTIATALGGPLAGVAMEILASKLGVPPDQVQKVIGLDVKVKKLPTNDNRSYHISSKKIQEELGFVTNYNILKFYLLQNHQFHYDIVFD